MKWQKNLSELKQQEKTPGREKDSRKKNKQLTRQIIQIIDNNIANWIRENKINSETFTKELENIKKNKSELRNTLTEVKNILKEWIFDSEIHKNA